MAFILTEEQTLLRETAQKFFNEQVPVADFRNLRDSEDAKGYNPALWQQMAELGFAGILVDGEYGGIGCGAQEMGIVCQEAGRTLAATPLFSTAVLGAGLIGAAGSPAQKQSLLPKIANGETLTALALEETAHHAPAQVALDAKKSGAGYTLSGEKRFVMDGHIADKIIVAARTSGESGQQNGITLFIVDADTKGLTITRTSMVDSRNAANITFDKVAVAASDIVGSLDDGFSTLDNVLDMARACMAAEMLGGIEVVFDTTLTYLKERKQFGAHIGSFQALQHRAADMFCEIEICRSVVLNALSALSERRNDAAQSTSLAKARVTQAARLITNEGVQMHGGVGMTDEYDVGLYMKRARVQAQIFGDTRYHEARYADLGGY